MKSIYGETLTLDWGTDELHEECGVFGMYDLDGNDVASTIYYGLFALQHRGQESAWNRSERYIRTERCCQCL